MRALAKIAHNWISEKLQGVTHLCKDTREVIALLDSTTITSKEAVLLKLDVEQFYLSGQHDELIELVCSQFEGMQKTVLEKILWTVMGYQLVSSADGSLHRVMIGSGMGGVQSGAVSDLAFLVKVERKLPREGRLLYVRFRDDVLVVLESEAAAHNFCSAMRNVAQPTWAISVDELSGYGVPMLDLFVFRGPRFQASGRLDYYPYFKPTSRAVPLGPTSAHPRSVHESWPKAEIERIRRLSSRQAAFEHYSAKKLRRWADFFVSPVSTSGRRDGPLGNPSKADRGSRSCLRLVLRYHPALLGLQAALTNLCAEWSHVLRHVVGPTCRLHQPIISVAWRAAGKPLAMELRSPLKEEGVEDGG